MRPLEWLGDAVVAFNVFVIFYFLALNTIYLGLFLVSLTRVLRFVHRTFFTDYRQIHRSEMTWPVSIVVAAHDEERTIVDTVHSLLRLNYGQFEVVVVNDGSNDGTLQRLVEAFGLRRVDRVFKRSLNTEEIRGLYAALERPGLTVVDKVKGGKSDALNAGINVSRYPLFCSIDADSIIEDDALLRVVKPFMEAPQRTVAAGGIVRVVNGCAVREGRVTRISLPDRALPILQAVEYLRAFLTGRVGWSAMHSLLLISGAFGIYRTSEVVAVGGYSRASDTEDLELVVRLHRHLSRTRRDYRIVFVPDPVCWTEVPHRLGDLMRQRTRWHRGLVATLWGNRGMLLNPRYGRVGLVAVPYFFLFEMLGPLVEILGYVSVILAYLLGLLTLETFLLFVTVALLYGMFLSVAAILLEELSFRRYPGWLDLAKLVAFGVLENFGYRQLLSLFKIKGMWDLLLRRRNWGVLRRRGFGTAAASAGAAGRRSE